MRKIKWKRHSHGGWVTYTAEICSGVMLECYPSSTARNGKTLWGCRVSVWGRRRYCKCVRSDLGRLQKDGERLLKRKLLDGGITAMRQLKAIDLLDIALFEVGIEL